MIRVGVVIFQLVVILLIKLLFGDVSMNMEAPGQIDAGKEITVQVTLNKGNINGFSRFQMDLPLGITASNISSANADFSFRDQKVRLIWLRLPSDETITFSFSILCNERLKGEFELAGKFSFIEDNERKNVDLKPQKLAIVPSPSIDPSLIVDIKDFGKAAFPELTGTGGEIACIRQKPVWSDTNNEFLVTLLVNKESLKKFAKIEETVPPGFTAVNVESKDGIFTYKDNKAKFLWMNLPNDPYFTVSYKLIPSNGNKQAAINGVFSYIVDDKTKVIPILEKDVDLANLTPESVKSILNAPALFASTKTTTSKTIVNITKSDTAQNTAATTKTTVAQNTVKTTQPKISYTNASSDLLEPQSGIYYRVQLAAGHRPVNSKRYFKKYKLDDRVLKEQHEGWIKYSVGSFNVYKDARDFRIHIWNTTNINDAFVAAYNEGKRITVQEALMVANQKWYQ
jgi:hypothetical protein